MVRLQSARRVGCLVGVLWLVCPIAAEPERAAGPQAAAPSGTLPNFTGKVASVDASDLRGVRFKYDAGARSFWHSHDGALLILVEQGRGRAQVKGQKIQEFGPGEPIYLPANVDHWHGASANEGLTWIALTVGSKVTVVGPVSDDEYLGKK